MYELIKLSSSHLGGCGDDFLGVGQSQAAEARGAPAVDAALVRQERRVVPPAHHLRDARRACGHPHTPLHEFRGNRHVPGLTSISHGVDCTCTGVPMMLTLTGLGVESLLEQLPCPHCP